LVEAVLHHSAKTESLLLGPTEERPMGVKILCQKQRLYSCLSIIIITWLWLPAPPWPSGWGNIFVDDRQVLGSQQMVHVSATFVSCKFQFFHLITCIYLSIVFFDCIDNNVCYTIFKVVCRAKP
jgi:hypothetical protein